MKTTRPIPGAVLPRSGSTFLLIALILTITTPARAGDDFPRDWFYHDTDQQWQRHQELIGKPAPKLMLSSWLNGQVKPADMEGKIVVIDFWATWCGPCLAAIPHNNEMMEKYKDKGVLIVGVCGSDRGQEKMAQVAKERGIKYPTARDASLASAKAWRVMWWPTYGVIDRQGNLRALGLKPSYVEEVVDKLLAEPTQEASPEGKVWVDVFDVDKADLSPTGRNPYFILEPGYQLTLEGGNEVLTITVLDETREVDGVTCAVVEERETKNGKPVEVSRNFFAIHKKTNDVFYFGEEVDIYKDGQLVKHEGAWLAGKEGARFGLIMPGAPKVGYAHYQEIAPDVAMDRAEVIALDATFKTPAGEFKDCLKVEETTPLEPDEKEYKHYAPGIGLIQDGGLRLTKYANAPAQR